MNLYIEVAGSQRFEFTAIEPQRPRDFATCRLRYHEIVGSRSAHAGARGIIEAPLTKIVH